MIRRWVAYIGFAFPLWLWIPFTVSWAVGLTALFAAATDSVPQWRPDAWLLVTALTVLIDMMLMRALDDIRDFAYDRAHNPGRPLPSGMISERDLLTFVGAGAAVLLLINAGRGVALVTLAVQMSYLGTVIALDRWAGWPDADRLALPLAVNLPIQILLSLYIYAGFLRAEHLRPSAAGFAAVAAVTAAALCMEFGRKVTRRPNAGERTYVTVLGPTGTSLAALAAAVAATAIVVVILAPWEPGAGWGWLVLLQLALPLAAAARFAAGAVRWPLKPAMFYIPAMYGSFLAAGWLTKGTFG